MLHPTHIFLVFHHKLFNYDNILHMTLQHTAVLSEKLLIKSKEKYSMQGQIYTLQE